ncbi:hypothetical protein [Kribbella sp. NPDC049584]|uniref:cupin domain-containing protein n=1 Tax=Kribbella sp. NPDC049584 TaxID=3154833 RepID=UPI00341697DE
MSASVEWLFVISGRGRLWRGDGNEASVDLVPDRSIRIAPGTPTQFRADDATVLEIVVAVVPAVSDPMSGEAQLQVWDPAPDDKSRSYRAPDGSHILTMGEGPAGGVAICILKPGGVSRPVRHRTVEEIWYVVNGSGQISRRHGTLNPWIDDLSPGTAVDIGTGLTFQFRSSGTEPLRVVILTLPRWPGADESIDEPGLATW